MHIYTIMEVTKQSLDVNVRVFSKVEKVMDFLEYKNIEFNREEAIKNLGFTGKTIIIIPETATYTILKLEIDKI